MLVDGEEAGKNWYWLSEAIGFKMDLRRGVGEPKSRDWLVGLTRGLDESLEREVASPKDDAEWGRVG
jgi:hypothetical protein